MQAQRRCEELESASLKDRSKLEEYARENLRLAEEKEVARKRAREAEQESVTLRDRVASLDKVSRHVVAWVGTVSQE
jgi:hypothetical protein